MSAFVTARHVSLTIPRDTDCLSLVRRTVVDLASGNGFDAATTAQIEMAVDEAASNAIRHAAGATPISLEAEVDPRGITVTVCDGGSPFVFDAVGRGDLDAWTGSPADGGLGVLLIRRFMDEVECRHAPESGNALRMRKYLAPCPTSTS
jgi:serine/threonine-protein kinase RsbW